SLVSFVVVNPESRDIVSGSPDETVVVWDLSTGQRLRTLTGHQARVWSVVPELDGWQTVFGAEHSHLAVTPDGRRIVCDCEDDSIIVRDLATGQRIHTLTGHRARVWSVIISPDGRHIVSGSRDGTVAIWDFATGRCLRILAGYCDWLTSLAVSH